jgi:gliding motility-associated-like protein
MINIYLYSLRLYNNLFNSLSIKGYRRDTGNREFKKYHLHNKTITPAYSKILLPVFFFILFIIVNPSLAAINISAVNTTTSTCGNNGTATIVASSTKSNPSLMYEIISGPVTAPIQNNSTFSSLFPGTYTVRVYDIDFVHKDQQFTVAGNYQLPDLTPKAINPLCPGFADGQIIGQAVAGKGAAPYTWEMVSPVATAPQISDIFPNLESGSYTIKMTDACGNFQTRTVMLVGGGTSLSHWYDGVPNVYKVGCDTMVYSLQIKILNSKSKHPLTLTLRKTDGTTQTKTVYANPLDTINYEPGLYSITDTIAGVDYGDYLFGCVTDVCGYQLCANKATVAPYLFEWRFNTTISCGNKLAATLYPLFTNNTPYMYTGFKPPLSLTLYDVATNTLVDSTGCNSTYCTLPVKEQTAGKMYRVRVTDGCGEVYQQNVQWPVLAAPFVQVQSSIGCMDSTAVAYFDIRNFTSYVTIELLSGPTRVGSTKPGYEFSDRITYPKVFSTDLNLGFSLKNLTAGTYTYRVSDTCGHSLNGTFKIDPVTLADFHYSYSIKKGCLGDNILYFDPTSNNTIGVNIQNLSTQQSLYYRFGGVTKDSLTSLAPGKYELKIYYGYIRNVGGGYYNAQITDGNEDCWALTDTITIPPYSNNTFQSNTSIFCNGTSYVEINVDSTRGVPPYQYEISNGPQTFPLQNSNIFQLPTYGNYVIRIRDACGNSNIRQISVDSAKFPPIIKKGASCTGSKIVLKGTTSSFFSYEWKKPNGTIHAGDSLVIDPLGPSDTGTYIITKKVTINGCTDTFTSTYDVELHDVTEQRIPFCAGTSIHVGTNIYTLPGIYKDTLRNELGCDSIITTILKKNPQKIDTNNVVICKDDHITVGSNIYTITGTYKDSIQNPFGCYDLTITNLYVNGIPDTIQRSICAGTSLLVGTHAYTTAGIYTDTLVSYTGCDSIVVHDLTVTAFPEFAFTHSICAGKSYTFLSHTYTQAGVYRDTVPSGLCKNIMILTLTVDPYKKDSIAATICEGEKYVTGGRTYTQTGIYRDTVTTASCDSITIVNLTVLPLKRNTITRSICEGQQVAMGIHIYRQSGVYNDTLATSGCDSIITLNLTVNPYKRNALNKTICSGESIQVGTHVYMHSGIYSDTLTTIGCDSIVTLTLHVNPLPAVSLGKDTSLCTGASLLLSAGNGFAAYYWNDNTVASSASINVHTTGKYWVKVENQYGCTKNDTMEILNMYPLPTVDAGPNVTLCYGASTDLHASGGIKYVWTPGNINQTHITVSPITNTIYYVTATDINNCSASDDVLVSVHPMPALLLSSTDTDHCFDESTKTIRANWGQSFVWTPSGETTQSIQVSQEGTYTVTVTDIHLCSYTEQITLKNICETKIFVPTGFTPNGDGLHDDLEIFGKNFTNFKITIFNRWGEIIFISTDRDIRWNGIYLDEEMPIGSYPWIITYESIFDTSHKEHKMNGSITLVR